MVEKITVATPMPEYLEMQPRWKKVDDVMGGTEAMRAAGKEYFPQMEGESDDSYGDRLARCVLFNLFKDALDMLAGKVFSKPVKLGDKMEARLLEWAENDIDRKGRDVNRFARNVFYAALKDRTAFLLADYPDTAKLRQELGKREDQALTEEEEKKHGIRPYLVHLDARRVIEFKEKVIGGRKVPVRVRIQENETVEDRTWGQKTVERIRVLEPGLWTLYEKVVDKGREEWVLVENGTLTLQKVPCVRICLDPDREDANAGMLPLDTLLDLNLLHWASNGDLNNIIHFAQRYVLFGKGLEPDEPIRFGVNRIIRASNPQADLKVVEHTGASIKAGQDHVERIENRMRVVSASLLVKRPGDVTATENALDAGAQDSKLGQMAMVFRDCLELAFQFLAEWLGLDPKSAVDTVEINTAFSLDLEKFQKLEALEKARARGDISQQTFLEAMKRHEVLPEDHDVLAEIQLTRDEADRAGAVMNEFGNPGNQKPETEEEGDEDDGDGNDDDL